MLLGGKTPCLKRTEPVMGGASCLTSTVAWRSVIGSQDGGNGPPIPRAVLLHVHPPNPRPNSATFADLFCDLLGFLDFADLFCRFVGFLGFCRFVLPFCWGFWDPRTPDLEASL